MQAHSASPTMTHIASVLWFPFFFAASFALLFLSAFANPQPHDTPVGIISPAPVSQFANMPRGIDLVPIADTKEAVARVSSGDLAAATDGDSLFVASAASPTRADYLRAEFARVAPGIPTVDVKPAASGDVSGVGMFFYALPNLLIGLITSIVLLQFGAWPLWKKALTIAATGAFCAVFSFVLASGIRAIPADTRLIAYALLLTQVIGWLTSAAALYAKRLFMPVAMTFVLVLGIPSSGGTVNADMLPVWIRQIGDWHPFAQFIRLARADAYFGTGIARPLVELLGWAALGAALLLAHEFRGRRRRAVCAVGSPPSNSAARAAIPTRAEDAAHAS